MEKCKEYLIGLPIDNFYNKLEDLWGELKKYEGSRIVSVPRLPLNVTLFQKIPLSPPENDVLISFHVGAINSYIFGYNPLVINYYSRYGGHIVSFSNLKISLFINKIVCEGNLQKDDEPIKCEYFFAKDC